MNYQNLSALLEAIVYLAKEPVSLLRPNVPKEVSKDLYISNLRRDYNFYSKMLSEAGF